ncbi:MAG: hypothetical protein GY790_21255 [Bacteroidetes bacterium]|nr:hypothetical protein [Bacteroidota bacterium]
MNWLFAPEGHSPIAHQFIGGHGECLMVCVPEGHSRGADRPGAGVPPGRTPGRVSWCPRHEFLDYSRLSLRDEHPF